MHLRTDAGRADEPVLLEDEHGPVAVYGIPYLEPDVLHRAWDLPARSHHAALAAAMRRIRGRPRHPAPGTRSVVLAHAFVAGGLPSESERDIAVGGISVVPLELFDGIDYTALGHLHGRATLTDSVRYSGSPLAYSFSEADHVKGSWLVDLDAGGLAEVRFVPAPVARPLACLEGTSTTCSPNPGSACTRTPGCRRRSPTPPGRSARWSGCGAASRTPSPCGSPRSAARSRARARPPTAGPPTRSRSTSSATSGDARPLRPSPSCCRPRSSAARRIPTSWSSRDAWVSG